MADPRPVLFLDIDGVLNSAEWMRAGHMRPHRGPRQSSFDPAACARLERVLRTTGAQVVISSSWRITHTTDAIESMLRERGAVSAVVIGETPRLGATRRHPADGGSTTFGRTQRGDEIAAWLRKHPEVTRWAIVDDDNDMGALRGRLVRTSWARGLEEVHVDALIRALAADPVTSAEGEE